MWHSQLCGSRSVGRSGVRRARGGLLVVRGGALRAAGRVPALRRGHHGRAVPEDPGRRLQLPLVVLRGGARPAGQHHGGGPGPALHPRGRAQPPLDAEGGPAGAGHPAGRARSRPGRGRRRRGRPRRGRRRAGHRQRHHRGVGRGPAHHRPARGGGGGGGERGPGRRRRRGRGRRGQDPERLRADQPVRRHGHHPHVPDRARTPDQTCLPIHDKPASGCAH
mmetsp:Transcript_42611/g.70587  ORF Transcript_42611/g.70587 Transcript_42611/m.70587 type:complete len:221 (-) Transcript_42611:805-1467(-)